jgi:4'-phosphopantetheinyl transferase EntD
VIEDLLPPPAVTAESFGDIADVALFPEEEAHVARAVAKRRREFSTVRACARQALGELGEAPAPLLPGLRGAPGWPPGIVGSMTHCEGYRASAVARDTELATIGLDAEPDGPLPDGVLDLVSDEAERAWISELSAKAPEVSWDRLLFSAKESVYKAWFPLTCRWLDFAEATITVSPGDGTFRARLLVTGRTAEGRKLTGFRGRWLARDGLVLTAIAVPAGQDEVTG